LHSHGVTDILKFLEVITNGFIETFNVNLKAIKHANFFYEKYKNLINFMEKVYRHEEKSLGNVEYLSKKVIMYYDFLEKFQK
jgi:hypothetical protein